MIILLYYFFSIQIVILDSFEVPNWEAHKNTMVFQNQ
jgi:hypothetical protein